jgi:hypothetical protein
LWTICLGCFRTSILLISTSWVVRIIGVSHWYPASSFPSPQGWPGTLFSSLSPSLGGTGVWTQGFNTCKTGVPSLEPLFQYILRWLFWRWFFSNYLPGLSLNWDSPNLSLPNN